MSKDDSWDPRWYYEMGKDAAKRPNQKISNGAFAILVICLVLVLRLAFGVLPHSLSSHSLLPLLHATTMEDWLAIGFSLYPLYFACLRVVVWLTAH